MTEPLTPAQRSMRARIAAYRSWANTTDPAARTAPARKAAFDRFEREVDPDGTLDPAERRRRAEAARRAYMTDLAYRASRARQQRRPAQEPTVANPDSDEVWRRIVAHAGETFTQIRGGTFTYDARGDALHLDRTNQVVARSQIDEALTLVPLASTVPVQHLRAPSYIYAILMDPRIREGEW